MRDTSRLFGVVFGEPETYSDHPPSSNYLKELLLQEHFLAFAALNNKRVVGALVAYELKKFERQRSEIYIYDLAVHSDFRRQGIATDLIDSLCQLARKRGISTVFVQADTSEQDAAAIALYTKLGVKEEVLHFDITRPFTTYN